MFSHFYFVYLLYSFEFLNWKCIDLHKLRPDEQVNSQHIYKIKTLCNNNYKVYLTTIYTSHELIN